MRVARNDDSGVGLVEFAVAIVVLGVLLVAFFPLVVSSAQLAVRNTAIAQANQLLDAQLDLQRVEMTAAPCHETRDPDTNEIVPMPFTVDDPRYMMTREVTCDGTLATLTLVVFSEEHTTVVDGEETREEFARATTKVVTA